MDNFIFNNPTKIIFGKDQEKTIGFHIRNFSNKVLLCYGNKSIQQSGVLDTIKASLNENDITYVELPGIQPNPTLSLVQEGIAICRANDIKFILAAGGGSVIDTAKAIAVGVPYSGEVWDFYEGSATVNTALPVGVVLTIPAAGSEASNSSVITNEKGLYKRGLTTNHIYPVFSILNPELTYTLPAYSTACGAADMMAHVIERYFTNVQDVDLTDRLCEAVLKTIIHNAPLAIDNPDHYNYRAEIMWSGTIAHNNLLATGRVGDWASHDIEHELSALYDISHGAGLSIILPAWMKYVYKHDINRFVQFAVRVWDVQIGFSSPKLIAYEAIQRMTCFFQELGLPVTLKDVGISNDKFEEMANKCTNNDTQTVGNFVKLNKQDVLNIYNLAL